MAKILILAEKKWVWLGRTEMGAFQKNGEHRSPETEHGQHSPIIQYFERIFFGRTGLRFG